MTQRNTATVNIGPLQRVVQIPQRLHHHRSERLVDLQEVQIRRLPAGLTQRRGDRLRRLGVQVGVRTRGLTVGTQGSKDLKTVGLRIRAGGQHDRRGTVGDLRGRRRGDRPVGGERRTQTRQRLLGRPGSHTLVGVDDDGALAGLDLHRGDLVGEGTVSDRGLDPLVRSRGNPVLLSTGDPPGGVALLSLHTHRGTVHRISQTVTLQGILQRQGTELRPGTHTGSQMRRIGHRLLTTGDHHVGVPETQQTGPVDHRVQTRQADLVHGVGRGGDRHTGSHRRLLGRVLTGAGLHDLTHDHMADSLGGDTGALKRGTDGGCTEVHGRLGGQGPEHLALGGARGTDDDDVLGGGGGLGGCSTHDGSSSLSSEKVQVSGGCEGRLLPSHYVWI